MCFVGAEPLGLDVDTATGNLYFTRGKQLMRSAKNDNTQKVILEAPGGISGIAIDQLNR